MIWPTDETQIGTTNQRQTGPMSNKGVVHILQMSKSGISFSDAV